MNWQISNIIFLDGKKGGEHMFVNKEDFFHTICQKHIAVIGIGISNTPLIKLLVEHGAKITACDKKSKEELGSNYNELLRLGVSFSLGDDYLNHLCGNDYIFKTPGMRFDQPELLKAAESGSIITSEMEVFFDICPAKIIAVTGSDGKTTTTTLIYNMLKESNQTCWLGGNIGTPLLSKVSEMKADDIVVLELSSFQLHTMKKSPQIAVITNISPNHLDMHKSYQEYIDAKKNIYLHQNTGGRLVLNFDNSDTWKCHTEAIGNVVPFSRLHRLEEGVFLKHNAIYVSKDGLDEQVLKISDIKLPGVHNVENYMAAIGAVYGIAQKDAIFKVANTFGGVEHRIELVREKDGVKYYNSSIDSSPNRTKSTLNVFEQKVILISGGKDKGIPYDSLGAVLADHVKTLILIGATAEKIYQALKTEQNKRGGHPEIPVVFAKTYEEAVLCANSVAQNGDIVVLSPASTSFDMFQNFEERGNLFKKLVNNL